MTITSTGIPPGGAAVAAYAGERGITDVLHFTTNKGLLGILATRLLLSRDRLSQEKYVQHIYTPNCKNRSKDSAWTDYVNLSVSRVNGQMLGVSEGWHSTEDLWWAVLKFDASLLSDPDVHFVTTNNTYTDCLQRGPGIEGLSALFADSVEWGWYGCRKYRYRGMPDSWTTDPQAEVLYPRQVPVQRLRAVYVREGEHADTVRGWFSTLGVPPVPVEHRPEVFQ